MGEGVSICEGDWSIWERGVGVAYLDIVLRKGGLSTWYLGLEYLVRIAEADMAEVTRHTAIASINELKGVSHDLRVSGGPAHGIKNTQAMLLRGCKGALASTWAGCVMVSHHWM